MFLLLLSSWEAMAYLSRAKVSKIALYVGVQNPQHMPSGSTVVDNIMRIIQGPLVVVFC